MILVPGCSLLWQSTALPITSARVVLGMLLAGIAMEGCYSLQHFLRGLILPQHSGGVAQTCSGSCAVETSYSIAACQLLLARHRAIHEGHPGGVAILILRGINSICPDRFTCIGRRARCGWLQGSRRGVLFGLAGASLLLSKPQSSQAAFGESASIFKSKPTNTTGLLSCDLNACL